MYRQRSSTEGQSRLIALLQPARFGERRTNLGRGIGREPKALGPIWHYLEKQRERERECAAPGGGGRKGLTSACEPERGPEALRVVLD